MAANEDLKNILGPMDIGTFTAPTVTANKPTLTTDPNAAIFKDVSPGYNLTSFGMDPYATSSLYADQLARESGARGLRPEEIDTLVTGAYENVLGRAADPEGAAYWGSQLASGAVSPGELAQQFISAAQAGGENIIKDKYGQYPFATLPTYGPSMPAPPRLTMEKPVVPTTEDTAAETTTTEAASDNTLGDLLSGVTTAPEGATTVTEGTQPAVTDNLAFLQQAYRDTLGRELGTEGQEWYLPKLQSGEMTQDQLIANLKASEEYKNLTNATYATGGEVIKSTDTLADFLRKNRFGV